MNLKPLLYLIFLYLAHISIAQEPSYHQYTTANGLPSSEVYDIIQDDYGYLWFSTDYGICRYDGYEFNHYSVDDGLTGNVVFKFFQDHTGKIWCTTLNNTLFHFHGREPHFEAFKFNHLLPNKAQNIPNSIFVDSVGGVHLTYVQSNGYLHITKDGHVSNKLNDPYPSFELYQCHNTSNNLGYTSEKPFFDDDNIVLKVCSSRTTCGLYVHKLSNANSYYSKPFKSLFFANGKNLHLLDSNKHLTTYPLKEDIIQIGVYDTNHIWVSSFQEGITIFTKTGKYVTQILKGFTISSLYNDHEGSVWLSSLRNGVLHILTTDISNLNITLKEKSVNSIGTNSSKHIWVGLMDGSVYRKNLNSFDHIYTSKSKRKALIVTINDTVFFISDYCFNSIEPTRSLFTTQANEVFKQIGTTFYAGTHHSLTIKNTLYAKRSEILGYKLYDLELFNDTIFCASLNGLYFIKGQKELILADNRYANIRIQDLEIFQSKLILGTKGKGILIKNHSSIEKITTKDGLASNFINKLHRENDTTLWVGTNKGVSRIKGRLNGSYTIKNLEFKDGISSNEINDLKVVNDTLWLATNEGLCFLSASFLDRQQTNIHYKLAIQSVHINDEEVLQKESYQLAYHQNRIEFHFKAFSFKTNRKLEYRYKLEGLENEWTYTTNTHALYTALPKGHFNFIVQIKADNEDWFEEVRITVNISPAFWTTWWFMLSIILLTLLIIYLFFRYRILQYNRDILRELARQLTKRLRQKTPHIIVKASGTTVKIETSAIKYVKSDGNYLEIHTIHKKYVIRQKIGNFLNLVPDPLEFLQIRRSFIVRIDRITGKGKKHIVIEGEQIEVGNTYVDQLDKIIL